MSPSLILTVMSQVKGILYPLGVILSVLMRQVRVLEYLNREDAERAVKELGGRDLRGQAVRVDLFEDVSVFVVTKRIVFFNVLCSVGQTITAVTIAGTIAMIATGRTVPEMIVIEMSVTATNAMTVTVKKGTRTGVIGRALLLVAEKMIVAPGRLRLGGIMKRKGLQGTMIEGEVMMTGEVLTLIMIVVGTTAGTIAAAMKRTIGTKKGLPDTMGTAGGVEGGCRVVMVRGSIKKERVGTGD
jgi:hypothetical protein